MIHVGVPDYLYLKFQDFRLRQKLFEGKVIMNYEPFILYFLKELRNATKSKQGWSVYSRYNSLKIERYASRVQDGSLNFEVMHVTYKQRFKLHTTFFVNSHLRNIFRGRIYAPFM